MLSVPGHGTTEDVADWRSRSPALLSFRTQAPRGRLIDDWIFVHKGRGIHIEILGRLRCFRFSDASRNSQIRCAKFDFLVGLIYSANEFDFLIVLIRYRGCENSFDVGRFNCMFSRRHGLIPGLWLSMTPRGRLSKYVDCHIIANFVNDIPDFGLGGIRIGEALRPGPRLRRRGPRSVHSRDQRRLRWQACGDHGSSRDVGASRVLLDHTMSMLHVNMRGYISHIAEVTAMIRLMDSKPFLVSLNETFLTRAIEHVELEGYQVLCRHDRSGQWGGGVLVFVLDEFFERVTLVEQSTAAERIWAVVHSDQGPILVCCWYRPPAPGDITTLESFENEWIGLRDDVLGTVVLGDLNVHSQRWLKYSSGETVEGAHLFDICQRGGLKQLVSEPTRQSHLLDLVLADVKHCSARVIPGVSDHKAVVVNVSFKVPTSEEHERVVWRYREADWQLLNGRIEDFQWDSMEGMHPDNCAEFFTRNLLELAETAIPRESKRFVKSSHPWLTEVGIKAVQDKLAAQGQEDERAKAEQCSAILMNEFNEHVQRSRDKLVGEHVSPKKWWIRARQLLQARQKTSSIPALKKGGEWIIDAQCKADCFVDTFAGKNAMCDLESNEYSEIDAELEPADEVRAPDVDVAVRILQGLDESSGTGPDLVPTKILKTCAQSLAYPIWLLAVSILTFGAWPVSWKEHWITPLHKKKAVSDSRNYRGVHLTSQVSKVLERLLGTTFIPYLHRISAFGPNQFAYLPKCGARDALALLVLTWVQGFGMAKKFAIYCSDVSGAFDKVNKARLLLKLKAKGVACNILRVLESWLGQRTAHVVVAGTRSKTMVLDNMVYQGTVWGPSLWNVHYADAKVPIELNDFVEVIFADDLNAYRAYDHRTPNDTLIADMKQCQADLHQWGRANQVTFDESKESMHVIGTHGCVFGGSFRLLGCSFDGALTMLECISELAGEACWKLKTILRSQRFFNDSEMVRLYKSKLLSYIEYRTPAIFHACDTHLRRIDSIQDNFLADLGIGELDVLFVFNLAPLAVRRQIAMLGVIHRSVLGLGPQQLAQFFVRKTVSERYPTRGAARLHDKQLVDIRDGSFLEVQRRSALGLVWVYNRLPGDIVEAKTVSSFQGQLQDFIKARALDGCEDWQDTLNPRTPAYRHPLR